MWSAGTGDPKARGFCPRWGGGALACDYDDVQNKHRLPAGRRFALRRPQLTLKVAISDHQLLQRTCELAGLKLENTT